MTRAFENIRVLDLSNRLSGAYAARIYGDFGAEVILAERPGGHALRDLPVLHSYANWNKQSIKLEQTPALLKLIESSDVVITDEIDQSDPVICVVNEHKKPETVHLSITPHGLDGNLAGIKGNNLTACARTGFSYINVYENEPPLQLPNNLTGYVAGVAGFIISSAVLHSRRLTGIGDTIDLSEIESLAVACHPWGIQAIFENRGWSRGVLGGQPRGSPRPLWQARDGLINFGIGDFRNWTDSMKLMGLDEFAHDEDLKPDLGRHGNPRIADVTAAAVGSILDKGRGELFHGLSRLRSICGMVRDMSDVYSCEHLKEREFFRYSKVDGKNIKFPGPPARLFPLEWDIRSPAPALHEHHGKVDLDRKMVSVGPGRQKPSPDGPLSGIRVLTFAHAWSGPFATELLGLLGAEVVQIEAPHRADVWRRTGNSVPEGVRNGHVVQHPLNTQGLYNSANLNKRALTLDMSQEEGQDIFWRLVPHFDVLLENFTPQIMGRWGITLEALEEKRPGIIFASLSAYGATGPYKKYPGNGGTTEPMSGLSSIHGYEGDKGMNTGGMIPDPISGYFMVASIMSALHAKDLTGKGQRIEGSMLEAMVTVVGDALGEFQSTGIIPRPSGNRHPRIAPHNVYRTKEENGWVAIAIQEEDTWCEVAKLMGVSADSRFNSREDRKLNEDRLDEIVSEWTRTTSSENVEKVINDLGGCSARVVSLYELYTKPDPNLLSRGFLSYVKHPETGINILPTRSWKFKNVESSEVRHSPCVGQHSREILREFLDINDKEYQSLVESSVTGTIYDYERYNES
ncbi:MAG: CoA transferase [Chloroflexota bacterium]|nr:CoA transferase [Chloroflexota bacterium]